MRAVLPHAPTSPNAYDPCDTALGFIGGILCGADKLARVAHLAHDPAVAEVLGIEAIPSHSTLSRFFARCGRGAGEALSGLHRWALEDLPARREGYTLDLDSFSLLHEDGHQEGVRVGYTRKGLKPCHRPIIAAIAEVPQVAHFWLRPGNTDLLQRGGHVPRRHAQPSAPDGPRGAGARRQRFLHPRHDRETGGPRAAVCLDRRAARAGAHALSPR